MSEIVKRPRARQESESDLATVRIVRVLHAGMDPDRHL